MRQILLDKVAASLTRPKEGTDEGKQDSMTHAWLILSALTQLPGLSSWKPNVAALLSVASSCLANTSALIEVHISVIPQLSIYT